MTAMVTDERLRGVMVKALIWEESNEGYAKGQWFADSIFGEYCTYLHPPTARAWLKMPGQAGDFFDTIDEAKAAAQADYAARILSALALALPAPPTGELVPVATMHVSDRETQFSKGWVPNMLGFRSSPLVPASALTSSQARIEALERELEWYGEQAAGCRKVTSEGDAARHALDADGGKRARSTLKGDAP